MMDNARASVPGFRYRRSPTAAEWDIIRPTFTDLYRLQNRRLVDVMRTLEHQHGFYATTKMYKSKIAAWGLDKNIKSHDARRLLRIKHRYDAAGQPCVLLYKGFLIDAANVERRCKRVRLKRDMSPTRGDGIPDLSELQCVPLQCSFSTINDPDSFSLVQCLLYHAAIALEDFAEIHSSSSRDHLWIVYDYEFDPLRSIHTSTTCFLERNYAAGGRHLRQGFGWLSSMFLLRQGAYFLDLDCLLVYLAAWTRSGFADVVHLVLRYLVSLSEIHVPLTHPYRTILRVILQLFEIQWQPRPFLNIYRALRRARMHKILPSDHAEVMWSDLEGLAANGLFDPTAYLAWVEETCGAESERLSRAASFWISKAYYNDNWELAETLTLLYEFRSCSRRQVRWAVRLAYCQAMLHKHSSTMENLQLALDLIRSGACDIRVLVLHLCRWDRLLPWLRSLPPEHDTVIEFHALLKEYDDDLERRDQEEQQDTMLAMRSLGFGC